MSDFESIHTNEEDIKTLNDYTVDLMIPVYRPDHKLEELLQKIYTQTKKPNKVILLHTVESEKDSLHIPEIEGSNIHVYPIDKHDFDHGGTRRLAADQSVADILMFMTQDAVPVNDLLIEKLIAPYFDSKVGATYARQISNDQSDILETFTREFNYPNQSRMKSSKDIEELGIKTFFCSNVCATYRNDLYYQLGGFVEKTIFNEDMIMAFKIIGAGYKIAYQAQAEVIHSHQYSYIQQFTRNFDLGVSHSEYEEFFRSVKSESEGIKLVKRTLQHLIDEKRYLLIPDLIFNSAAKYLGYKLGVNYKKLPKDVVLRCSMNKSYWKD